MLGSDAGAAPDYSFLPEAYRSDDGPDIDGFKGYLDSLEATKAQYDERATDIPESADGYEFALPDLDFKEMGLPEDFSLELNPDDEYLGPLLKEFGDVLHKNGIPKSAVGDFMGVLAKYEAMSHLRGAKEAEVFATKQKEALGPKADARISNVKRLLESRLSADQAKDLMQATLLTNAFKGVEQLLSPRGLGAGGNSPPRTRTPEDDLRAYYTNPK